MGFFTDADELDKYVGGVFRDAGDHPESGPKLRAANIVMRVFYTAPDCEVTIAFRDDYQMMRSPSSTSGIERSHRASSSRPPTSPREELPREAVSTTRTSCSRATS